MFRTVEDWFRHQFTPQRTRRRDDLVASRRVACRRCEVVTDWPCVECRSWPSTRSRTDAGSSTTAATAPAPAPSERPVPTSSRPFQARPPTPVISCLWGYSIIGSGSGFAVNLGSDSLGKSNDLGVSNVSRIHFGFGFIVNPDPDPIIEYPLYNLYTLC